MNIVGFLPLLALFHPKKNTQSQLFTLQMISCCCQNQFFFSLFIPAWFKQNHTKISLRSETKVRSNSNIFIPEKVGTNGKELMSHDYFQIAAVCNGSSFYSSLLPNRNETRWWTRKQKFIEIYVQSFFFTLFCYFTVYSCLYLCHILGIFSRSDLK